MRRAGVSHRHGYFMAQVCPFWPLQLLSLMNRIMCNVGETTLIEDIKVAQILATWVAKLRLNSCPVTLLPHVFNTGNQYPEHRKELLKGGIYGDWNMLLLWGACKLTQRLMSVLLKNLHVYCLAQDSQRNLEEMWRAHCWWESGSATGNWPQH